MLTYNLIQIILSKTEKRVLVIFCLLFLLIILFIGLLAKLYKKQVLKIVKKSINMLLIILNMVL